MASAQRKSGNANMRARVPALPTHCTSMRRAPAAARARTATLTDDLTGEHEDADDQRHAALHDQRDAGDEEEDAVGHGVEHLAEVAALVEATGDPAVDPVGRTQHREQAGGGEELVVGQQPDEHGHTEPDGPA